MPQQPDTSFADDLKKLRAEFAADIDAARKPTGPQIVPGTAPKDAIAQMHAYNQAEGLEGGDAPSWLDSVMTFGKELAINQPIEALKGIYSVATTNPWETVKGLARAQVEQFQKGKQAFDEGRYSEAYGHTVAGALPLLGPAAADVGETIGRGDIAKGLAQGTFLVGTAALPSAAKAGAKGTNAALQATRAGEAVAPALERAAVNRFVRAVAPETGANKVRFGNAAADAAPQVLREEGMGAVTRGQFAQKVSSKLQEAETALDEAADARLVGHAFDTKPILDALMEKRRALTAEAVEGSATKPAITTHVLDQSKLTPAEQAALPASQKTAQAIGSDVVPAHNLSRVAQIDEAIREVKTLGPQARYESLRRIRQSFDQPARAKYNQAMTPDFLKKMGEASGAADVTAVLRDHLAGMDPATAAANKPYALWRKVNDVLEAAEETERVRPKVGRSIMARLTGALVGGEAAGGYGAALGAILAPTVEKALGGSVTTKILTARALTQLADALKKGNVQVAEQSLKRLRIFSTVGQARSAEDK